MGNDNREVHDQRAHRQDVVPPLQRDEAKGVPPATPKSVLVDKFLATAIDKGFHSIGMDEAHLPDK